MNSYFGTGEPSAIRIEPLDKWRDSAQGPSILRSVTTSEYSIRNLRSTTSRMTLALRDITTSVHVEDGSFVVIKPGEMILGITRERITLADNISGRLEGRSRFARFGLAVHVTAGFMHPGISNHQVLEIVNLGHAPLALYPDTRICQFVFEKCDGHAEYHGRFAEQTKP